MCLGFALFSAVSLAAAQQATPQPQTQARTTEDQSTMPPRSATTSAAGDIDARASFGNLDKDKDGRVSSTEAGSDAGFDAGFAAMDANGDGFVSDTEYRAEAKANAKMEDKQPGGSRREL